MRERAPHHDAHERRRNGHGMVVPRVDVRGGTSGVHMRRAVERGPAAAMAHTCRPSGVHGAVCVAVALTLLVGHTEAALPASEVAALKELYAATNGEWWRYSWQRGHDWPDGDPCDRSGGGWYGVICDGEYSTVTTLNLEGNNLTGVLPYALGDLTGLVALNVQNNHIGGNLPLSFGTMPSLQSALLFGNQLTGPVPSLCVNVDEGVPPNLVSLNLQDNLFTDWPNYRCYYVNGGVSQALTSVDVQRNRIVSHIDPRSGSWPTAAVQTLNAADNPGLIIDAGYLVGSTQLSSLNLARTGATTVMSPITLPWTHLRQVVFTGCASVTTGLPENLVEAPFLEYVDGRGTGMLSPTGKLPPWLTLGAPETVRNGTAACYSVVAIPPATTTVLLDPAYDNFSRCYCLPGHAGSVQTGCSRCAPGSFSRANASACEVCPRGSAQPRTSARDSPFTCIPCAAGSEAPEGTVTDDGKCRRCADGSISGASAGACVPCSAGSYALSNQTGCAPCRDGTYAGPGAQGRRACFVCPDGVACSAGAVSVPAGWWWQGALRLRENTTLYPCLSARACPAPDNAVDDSTIAACELGGGPPLCAVCTAGFTRSGTDCLPCPSSAANAVLAGAGVLVTAAFVTFVLYRRGKRAHAAAARASSWSGPQRHADSSAALRTLVTFLQLSALASQFRLNGRSSAGSLVGHLHGVIEAASGLVGDGVAHVLESPLSCSLPGWTFPHTVVASAALPLACVVLAAAFAGLARCACRRHFSALPFWHDVASASVALFFVAYSRVTRIAMSALKTYPHAIGGVTYLQADLRVTTENDGYGAMQAAAAGMLLLYTVAAPAFALVALRRWLAQTPQAVDGQAEMYASLTASLSGPSADARRPSPFALLLRGYRRTAWWWEATVVGRKVAFAALVVFVDDGAVQSMAACVLLFALGLLQAHQRPFADAALNAAETLSLFALFATRALYMLVADTPGFAPSGAGVAAACVVGALNVGTVAVLLALYWRHVRVRRIRDDDGDVGLGARGGSTLALTRVR